MVNRNMKIRGIGKRCKAIIGVVLRPKANKPTMGCGQISTAVPICSQESDAGIQRLPLMPEQRKVCQHDCGVKSTMNTKYKIGGRIERR